jgi:antitoxin Phd
MTTQVVTATELKNRLGAYLDAALVAPVFVQKSGRQAVVLVSQRQYEQWQALEDELWALRAQQAEHDGYVSPEDTQRALDVLSTRAGTEC